MRHDPGIPGQMADALALRQGMLGDIIGTTRSCGSFFRQHTASQ